MTTSGPMDELGFDGVPLAPGSEQAPGAGTCDPDALALALAQQVQRTHAAVVTAHQALIDWRTGRGGPREPTASGAGLVLRAAARAVPEAEALRLVWHGPVPGNPARPEARTGPAGCRIHDGDRLVLDVTTAGPPASSPEVPRHPPEFRPLAATTVQRLSAAGLDALARGEFAAVLGPGFDQGHLEPGLRPEPWGGQLLTGVEEIVPHGGRWRQGAFTATVRPAGTGPLWPHLVTAAVEALRVYAFHRGMHLCLPGAHAVPLPGAPAVIVPAGAAAGPLVLRAEVTALGMMPRPYATAECEATDATGRVVARLHGIGVALYGRPELDERIHADRADLRRTAAGGRAVLTELHMAHAAEGEWWRLAPENRGRDLLCDVRPRLPRGDLLMIDRGVAVDRAPAGRDANGTRGTTEYDMPADPWYARENGVDEVPLLALMEIALQPAGLLSGIALDVVLDHPDRSYVCRNLEGRGRLLRAADPRGRTVTQHITLLSVTDLPGASLHRYAFELATADGPFYAGEATHGYFTQEVLDLQQGLDGGRRVPPWETPPETVLRLDAREDPRLGTGRLALLEELLIVPGGGDHGAGYARCAKPVRPDDWYFDRHFFKDPVMPGSAGVEMLVQAVRAYALHTGLTDGLPYAGLRHAVGEETQWSYRGQILRGHGLVQGDVHLREARRDGDRLLLRADGSVWRDGLRIYHVRNIVLTNHRPEKPR
ncbi:3-hydroxyacyl-ACP dehydratase [Streptomyces sp. AV19]|uniref:3-hydroxyacyl-ACP dehydratase n=1 Tax=Streptomyces sp. AV19 TaxID=2793068 RepID=UPI0018FEB9F2|nr:3-hydroxyacyl-ACP dehydratase [Streptomyces sp. AV19]MBH1933292.1 3-hydroxyacyl-ACP dehydratase [Streptomyces sp. AV19]MDG4536183.1 3-hydroxyacyl-ACP dehydratase [Streptomyces sp. AV19]